MTPEERERRRKYTANAKRRWAAISVPTPVAQRIYDAAKARNITQAQVIERACAGVGR